MDGWRLYLKIATEEKVLKAYFCCVKTMLNYLCCATEAQRYALWRVLYFQGKHMSSGLDARYPLDRIQRPSGNTLHRSQVHKTKWGSVSA